LYTRVVTPRLWNETVDAHRRSVRDATLDATAELVAEHGLAAVTMSQIATRTGIGRATLYKYFPDVESILVAWHERQVARHLDLLAEAGGTGHGPRTRLEAVLTAYALATRENHGVDPAGLLHRRNHVAHAHEHLVAFVAELIQDGVDDGSIRDDVPPDELAAFCISALGTSGDLRSEAAVRRLVSVTLDGLRGRAGAGDGTGDAGP
jgi:AcrR family transcriptional regulator